MWSDYYTFSADFYQCRKTDTDTGERQTGGRQTASHTEIIKTSIQSWKVLKSSFQSTLFQIKCKTKIF